MGLFCQWKSQSVHKQATKPTYGEESRVISSHFSTLHLYIFFFKDRNANTVLTFNANAALDPVQLQRKTKRCYKVKLNKHDKFTQNAKHHEVVFI